MIVKQNFFGKKKFVINIVMILLSTSIVIATIGAMQSGINKTFLLKELILIIVCIIGLIIATAISIYDILNGRRAAAVTISILPKVQIFLLTLAIIGYGILGDKK